MEMARATVRLVARLRASEGKPTIDGERVLCTYLRISAQP